MTWKRAAVVLIILAFRCAVDFAPAARADVTTSPCQYPFVGMAGTVTLGFQAGGAFCDGPTEVNGTHYHCEAGGANVSGGGIGLAPLNGFTFGGILGAGIGGGGASCTFRCPDNTLSRMPNPPQEWKTYMVVRDRNNDCLGHMTPAGFWSEPPSPDQGPPGFDDPHERLPAPPEPAEFVDPPAPLAPLPDPIEEPNQ